MNKLKTVLTILLSLIFYNTFSQAILNTEAMLKEIDSTFAFKLNVDGNMNFGNIELTEIGSSLTLGKKIKNSLVRMSLGYEYISEDKEILSNDWTGQIRYNKFFNKNSVFLFIQGSKIKSLKLSLTGTSFFKVTSFLLIIAFSLFSIRVSRLLFC